MPATLRQQQAVQTARTQLDTLNATMTRVLYATATCAALLAIMAGCCLYAAWEYTRVKSAISQAQAQMSRSFPTRPPMIQ